MADNETTLRFKADISGLKKGITDANRQIRLANSAFQAAASGMEDWSNSTDGLTAKISQLEDVQDAEKKKLELLNKQYELTVNQLGATSREAQELEIQINRQQTTINRVTSELNGYRSQLENIANTATQSVSSYDRLTAEISQQEAELKQLQREYANYVVEGNDASNEARQLAAQISELSGDLNRNKKALNDADGAADSFADAMDDIEDAADDAGNATEKLSDGFTTIKGALADLVADGIRAAVDAFKELFTETDKAFNSFQAQTGTSTAGMAEFQNQISELYKSNFGDSMEDVADAMAKVAQTSKETDPSKIKDLTQNALILRDTFGYEIDESMRAVNMLMDQFGLTGEEAFNLIAQGAQNGLDKNGDLLDTINEYSVFYKDAGYSAEEFFNTLENGQEAGAFSIDKVADAMKEFTIKNKEGAEDVTDAWAELGLVQADNSKSIGATTKEITKQKDKIAELEKKLKYAYVEQSNFNEKTSDLKRMKMADNIAEWESELQNLKSSLAISEESLQSLQSSGGNTKYTVAELMDAFNSGGDKAKEATQDVMAALFALDDETQRNALGVSLFGTMWEDLQAEGVEALSNINGEMDSTAGTMDEINAIKYNDIGSAFEEIGRIIKVDLLQPLVNEVMPVVNEFIDWLKSDAVPWLMDHGNELVGIITSIGAAFVAFKAVTIIQGIISAFATLIPIIKSVGLAQAALNLIMAANPIGLIVAAIAGLVAAFIYFWNTSDEFRQFWIDLWEKVKETVGYAIEGIKIFFTGLWDKIKSAAKTAGQFVADIWTTVSEFFIGLWNNVSTAAGNAWAAIKEFFAPATEWFGKLFTSIKDTLSSVITVIIGLAKGCWAIIARVYEIVADWFNKNIIQPVSKFFSDMWAKISNGAKAAWALISGAFKTAATWFNNTIITPIATFFSDMWDKLKNGASAAWEGIKSVFTPVVDWFKDKFSKAWEAVKNVFSTGGKIFDGIKDGIVSAFKTVVNAIIRGINKIISMPFNSINKMLNKIRDVEVLGIQPFSGLWSKDPLSIPQIPELAQGGVLKRGQVGLLEGDGAEAVVPLEKNTGWIKRVAAEITQNLQPAKTTGTTNNSTVNNYTFNQTNNSPKALNRLEIYRQSKKQSDFIRAVTSGV